MTVTDWNAVSPYIVRVYLGPTESVAQIDELLPAIDKMRHVAAVDAAPRRCQGPVRMRVRVPSALELAEVRRQSSISRNRPLVASQVQPAAAVLRNASVRRVTS